MDNALSILLADTIQQRGISVREAARRMGIAHTTLTRIMRGKSNADTDTIIRICEWAGVSPATVLGTDKKSISQIAEQIAVMLNNHPDLAAEFAKAVELVNNGTLKPETLREIIRYMNYRIEQDTASAAEF